MLRFKASLCWDPVDTSTFPPVDTSTASTRVLTKEFTLLDFAVPNKTHLEVPLEEKSHVEWCVTAVDRSTDLLCLLQTIQLKRFQLCNSLVALTVIDTKMLS